MACSIAQSCPSFCNPWTVAHQAPLSLEFTRQGYWTGLPFPSPGGLPHPGIKPVSPALAGRFFITVLPGKPLQVYCSYYNYIKENMLVMKEQIGSLSKETETTKRNQMKILKLNIWNKNGGWCNRNRSCVQQNSSTEGSHGSFPSLSSGWYPAWFVWADGSEENHEHTILWKKQNDSETWGKHRSDEKAPQRLLQ